MHFASTAKRKGPGRTRCDTRRHAGQAAFARRGCRTCSRARRATASAGYRRARLTGPAVRSLCAGVRSRDGPRIRRHWRAGVGRRKPTRSSTARGRSSTAASPSRDMGERSCRNSSIPPGFRSGRGTSAFDILAGKLDGMVFRVTLARDGSPLVYDSIHPCGCYHMFFPTARVRELPSPRPDDEWTFVPAAAPAPSRGRESCCTCNRGRITSPASASPPAMRRSVRVRGRRQLRSLPLPGGGRRSIYGADGLVAGSERPERWLFWPMGVPSAGTMRQWGHNATAFLGRRHFDDADLIERRFAAAP